jgi:hypothetical protein
VGLRRAQRRRAAERATGRRPYIAVGFIVLPALVIIPVGVP